MLLMGCRLASAWTSRCTSEMRDLLLYCTAWGLTGLLVPLSPWTPRAQTTGKPLLGSDARHAACKGDQLTPGMQHARGISCAVRGKHLTVAEALLCGESCRAP